MFKDLLPFISKPSRYLGNEINSVHKDLNKVDLLFALAFPDVYEVGMSHLGLQILYNILNLREDIAAERVFAPWADLEDILRRKNVPLASLESSIPLSNFDIIGFSLQYELSFTNILNMLELGRIPFYTRERDERFPLIIAGGGIAFNPEPIADFFDAIVVGDGEEVILEIADCCLNWKKRKGSKQDLLDDLSKIAGVYIPSFFEIKYNGDGTIKELVSLKKGYDRIKKRIVADLNQVNFPGSPLVPHMQIVHNRLSVEVARGCTRGCRFCQAGMIYRPYRERKVDNILEITDQSINETGFEEISLLSLSTGDYSCIEGLIGRLMNRYAKRRVAISLPSLRPGTLTTHSMEEIKRVRKTGFTIAPEAGSERLRKVINKNISEKDLLDMANSAFNLGWNLLKLYFLIGLPTERKEDLEGIITLIKRISLGENGNKRSLNVSISTFIPKSHTPFQWEPQLSMPETLERQKFIKKKFNSRKIKIKCQNARVSHLEGIFSRGDRRLSAAIFHAYRLGCRFDGWQELLQFDLWEKALEKSSLNPNFYLNRTRDFREILPWDHIDCGVSKDFLVKEFQRAKQGVFTPDCRYSECVECGVCDHKSVKNVMFAPLKDSEQILIKSGGKSILKERLARKPTRRFRIHISKLGSLRLISHLELINLLLRAVRRARIPVKFSQGFHPHPKVSFGPALSVGVESLVEHFDIFVEGFIEGEEISGRLSEKLPPEIKIVRIEEISLNSQPLFTINKVRYIVSFKDNHFILPLKARDFDHIIKDFLAKEEMIVSRKGKNGNKPLNLRSLVDSVSRNNGFTWELVLKGNIGPLKVIQGIFQLSEEEIKSLHVLKTEVYF